MRERRRAPVVAALAEELATAPRLIDRETFRAAAARVRETTGQKGRALFHPIRLALTGRAEGPELDCSCRRSIARRAVAGRRAAAGDRLPRARAATFADALIDRLIADT